MRLTTLALACVAALSGCGGGPGLEPVDGEWHAWLDSPGGPLPFELELFRQSPGIGAAVLNGVERIEIPRVEWSGQDLVLGIDHYDSVITAELSADGRRLDGRWRRTAGPDQTTELAFHATAGSNDRFAAESSSSTGFAPVDGRWQVRFSDSDDPAVAILHTTEDGKLQGTFLTTTGDYRYLAGRYDDGRAGGRQH